MSRIEFEQFHSNCHPNPMSWFDTTQRKRHERAPNLIPYMVCLVTVKDFTFIFHSVEQIQLCLDYYQREHHPTSRLPVYTENHGGDRWETQRWFERLPNYLLKKPIRREVVSALEQALTEYSKIPGAITGVELKPYDETY